MKKLYVLTVFVLSFSGLFSQTLSHNFENRTIGDAIGNRGWSPATHSDVFADPLNAANKVMRFANSNWNAAPYLEFVLPAGKTLADYTSFKFKALFHQGDVGWKWIVVAASAAVPTGGHPERLSSHASAIGEFNRASGASAVWEDITIPITGNASLSGTVYIAFGINNQAIQASVQTIWYADDVELVGVATNTKRVFESESDIYSVSGSVFINGKENQSVKIFSITGSKLFENANAGSAIKVDLPKGIYVVVVNNAATKVVVK